MITVYAGRLLCTFVIRCLSTPRCILNLKVHCCRLCSLCLEPTNSSLSQMLIMYLHHILLISWLISPGLLLVGWLVSWLVEFLFPEVHGGWQICSSRVRRQSGLLSLLCSTFQSLPHCCFTVQRLWNILIFDFGAFCV